MRKLIMIAVAGWMVASALGQGLVSMNTVAGGAYMRVTNCNAPSSYAWGSDFYAGLYWANDYQTLAAGGGTLATRGTRDPGGIAGTNGTGLATFTGTSAANGGYISSTTFGGDRVLTGYNTTVWVQLRVWSNLDGRYLDWNSARSSGDSRMLTSDVNPGNLFAAPIVQVTSQASLITPVPQVQWAPGSSSLAPLIIGVGRMDFALPVPEPSTLALTTLGLCGLYFFRRRK